jgi:hypothetical protein
VARVGRLVLREGDWDGQRLLSREAVRQTTADAGTPGQGGMGWWSNNDGTFPRLPRDAFFGSGAGHQILLVVPSWNLIAVRSGERLAETGTEPSRFHEAYNRFLFEPLAEAIAESRPASRGAAPYPPSKVIARLDWAPPDTIVRKAKGSDNWPLTWADDDALYTAYGDGRGFEPFVPEKLSLGLARVTGGPEGFRGENLRASGVERKGDGAKGEKASGLLMVDGMLYLWVRNAGNARLGWSGDRGQTWQWADWKFTTSFGCPTFLNFGKNYAGARDAFVYVYSHDGDSAYKPADRMVLARAPKEKIREKAAYEFFAGPGKDGKPAWSSDISKRAAVFEHKGKCYRSGITYHSASKQYLWCQTLPGEDARFKGGFGVYAAPEPWGPWSTVYFTEEWDTGPGETSSLPTKWISTDGRTAWLLFSGDDHFSARKATLRLASP